MTSADLSPAHACTRVQQQGKRERSTGIHGIDNAREVSGLMQSCRLGRTNVRAARERTRVNVGCLASSALVQCRWFMWPGSVASRTHQGVRHEQDRPNSRRCCRRLRCDSPRHRHCQREEPGGKEAGNAKERSRQELGRLTEGGSPFESQSALPPLHGEGERALARSGGVRGT